MTLKDFHFHQLALMEVQNLSYFYTHWQVQRFLQEIENRFKGTKGQLY